MKHNQHIHVIISLQNWGKIVTISRSMCIDELPLTSDVTDDMLQLFPKVAENHFENNAIL